MGWFRRVAPATEAPATAPPTSVTPPRRRRPAPERLTSLSFDRFVREHPRVVIDIWASWCVPCRAFSPIFAQAAGDWGEVIGFGKVQAEHEPTLVARFGVRSIPSLLFFRDGKLVRTETGLVPQERLVRLLHRTFRDLP